MQKSMINMFFFSMPISKILERGIANPDREKLLDIIRDNAECDEIKMQMEGDSINRVIATERIPASDNVNIEKLCRQYANQDVVIKIRNGKKASIDRTRIIKP